MAKLETPKHEAILNVYFGGSKSVEWEHLNCNKKKKGQVIMDLLFSQNDVRMMSL